MDANTLEQNSAPDGLIEVVLHPTEDMPNGARFLIPKADSSPHNQYPDSLIIKVLHECRGRVYLAAERIGCHPETVRKRIRALPELHGISQFYRRQVCDKAERGLEQAVDRGDAWAITLAIKTLGKDRGYTERVESRNTTEIRGALVQFLAPQQAAGLLGLPVEALSVLPSSEQSALPAPTSAETK